MKLFRQMGAAHEGDADHGVVDLVMDVPDEGIPDALRHTIRAVAGGDVQHHVKG